MKNQIYLDFSEMQPTFETKSQRYEKKSGHQMATRFFHLLNLPFKIRALTIPKRTDCEMNPVGVTLPFYYQLIEILVVQV